MPYAVANLERAFKVKLPTEFKEFVQEKQYENYQGLVLKDLPFSVFGAKEYPVLFANRNLFDDRFFHLDRATSPGLVPLALLGNLSDLALDFLVVDIKNKRLPVFFTTPAETPASPRTNFLVVEPSLKSFLKRLKSTS
ncbi:MAG: SMI1/KNR4 family protein [Bdellovibrionia bacterium]